MPADSFRRDARVIGLVGVAHGLSHFFQLALPPLFPFLKAEFDVSWATLGGLVGAFYLASGLTQFAAGFAVDRMGARPVLLAGLALLAGSTLAAALVPGVLWLYPVVVLMGLGNGVFHPADFAILNANVAAKRLGHAYSTHGVGGNLGYALAPVVSFALASALGWRGALAAMGAVGLVAWGAIATQRAFLTSVRASPGHADATGSRFGLFLQVPIVTCFGYFVVQTMGSVGMQTFAGAALHAGFDVPLALATSAVTAYLLGGTAGIVAGGFIAVRAERHDLVAAGGLIGAATLVVLVATGNVAAGLLLPIFAAIGFALGSTGPSRDLIVRSATPRGAAGRVYGFVYSGLDIGAAVGPVWFGFLLDQGRSRTMFLAIAALFVVALATVVQVRRSIGARTVREA